MPLKTKEVRKPHPDAVEVRENRGAHSKTWAMPDGNFRCDVRVGTIQHYTDDNGSLRTCDTTIQQDAGKVFVDWLPYKFRLHDKGVGFDFQSRQSGRCSVTLAGIGGKPFDAKQKLNPIIEGDKITFTEVAPGLDIVFRVLPARVKSWRIVKSENAPRTFEWLCQHDKDGREKISDKLIGNDASGGQLELVSNVMPIDASSFQFVETWTGKVKVRDKKTRIKSLSDAVYYPVEIDPTVNEAISDTANDITERGSNQYDYRLYVGSVDYQAGLRFTSVNIPNGATINSATLSVNITASGAYGYKAFDIRGYDTDSAAAWSAGSIGPGYNAHTTAATNVPTPTSAGVKSYSVTSIIQEIVNRSGWASGNNISLDLIVLSPIFNYGQALEDYQDAGTDHAKLTIDYTAPSGGPGVLRCKRFPGGFNRMGL